jgi:hypothetical protein
MVGQQFYSSAILLAIQGGKYFKSSASEKLELCLTRSDPEAGRERQTSTCAPQLPGSVLEQGVRAVNHSGELAGHRGMQPRCTT